MPMVPPAAFGSSGEHWRKDRDVVLVVDDETPMRRVVSVCLTKAGYRPIEAASAHASLEILHSPSVPVRLLLTDLWMPDMDGFSLIRETRQFAPELPILAMTGMGARKSIEELLANFGISDLLLKPFTPAQLLASVHLAIMESDHAFHHPQ